MDVGTNVFQVVPQGYDFGHRESGTRIQKLDILISATSMNLERPHFPLGCKLILHRFASPAQSSTSNTLAAVMCDAEDPCSMNTAYEPESPRKTTRPLYCCNFLTNFEFSRCHKSMSVAVWPVYPSFLSFNNFLLIFCIGFLPWWQVPECVPLLVDAGFCIQYFHRLRQRNGFVHKIGLSHRIILLVSIVNLHDPFSTFWNAASKWCMSLNLVLRNRLMNRVVAWNCFPPMFIALLLLWRIPATSFRLFFPERLGDLHGRTDSMCDSHFLRAYLCSSFAFQIFLIKKNKSSRSSGIVELRLFFCPVPLFFLLRVLWHVWSYFWPYVFRPGPGLNFR